MDLLAELRPITHHQNPTQVQRVETWLKRYGHLDWLTSWRELGVLRLAARINELRKEGYSITTERKAVKNQFGETCHVANYVLER